MVRFMPAMLAPTAAHQGNAEDVQRRPGAALVGGRFADPPAGAVAASPQAPNAISTRQAASKMKACLTELSLRAGNVGAGFEAVAMTGS
jgi:hypothetical protein